MQDEDATLNAANSRIRSKGLVRFCLCPSDSCFDHFGMGCSSNYGEYVVDMYQFLEVYIAWQVEEAQYKCQIYRNTCYRTGTATSSTSRTKDCLQCGEHEIANANGEELSHYLGRYCTNQGGDRTMTPATMTPAGTATTTSPRRSTSSAGRCTCGWASARPSTTRRTSRSPRRGRALTSRVSRD